MADVPVLQVTYIGPMTGNVGDFGWPINLGVNLNLTTATSITLTITPPGGTDSTIAFTVGTTVLLTASGPIQPGFWVYRNALVGDFTVAGTYNAQLIAAVPGSPAQSLSSAPFSLIIGARI